MKTLRNLGIFFICLGITLQIIKVSCNYYIDYQKDKQQRINILTLLETNYEQIYQKMLTYKTDSQAIKPMYDEYLENIKKTNSKYAQIMNQLGTEKKDIDTLMQTMNQICANRYGETEITNKCNETQKNYDTLQQSFQITVKNYNYVIQEYNKWAKTKKYKELSFYQ